MSNEKNRSNVKRRNDYKPAHLQEQFIVPLLKENIEEAFEKYLVNNSSGKALDIGCGRQPFKQSLTAANYSYVGLDVEQNTEGTVDVVCAIDEPLPEELTRFGPFEFVLCTEVLEHVADWETAFKNLSALTASGGRVLITCPHFYQLHEEPHDFWRATPYALKYYAEKFDFQIVEQKRLGDAWDVFGTLLANSYPAPGSAKLSSRVLSRIVRYSKTRLFNWLRKGSLQSAVQMHGPLYLSNLIVLQRL